MLRRVALVRTNTPEDTILHSHRLENLNSFIGNESWAKVNCSETIERLHSL
jgi:hypothetical protein